LISPMCHIPKAIDMRTTLTIACWLIAITLLIVPACQREVSYHNGNPSGSGDQVTANLTGRITDPDNLPVQGALVKAGSASATTDIDGNFEIKNISLDKNAGFIKVEKPGFFLGSRTITVNAGTTNYIAIQLIKKTVSGTVNGSGNGTVTIANGGSIAFTPNSFVNSTNNTAYTGMVSVSAFFIDPAADNFLEIMPGALRGIDASNQETGLQSFGMMAVELNGAAGEKLQLASGKTATVTFPIPAGLLPKAPATIPLWSFNETTGLWKEEGTATKQGSNYVGTVNHFSFWNCDYPYSLVDFRAVIKNQANQPMANTMVELKTTDDAISSFGYGYTDDKGLVSGKVPYGKVLQMRVINKCNNPLLTQNIGPFSAKADLGTVTVNNGSATQVTISGTVVNCTWAAVTNGFVDIKLDNQRNRALINNGNFSITITRCINTSATAEVTAYDLDAGQNGTTSNLNVTTGTATTGQLSACGNALTEFVRFTLNGAQTDFVPPADSLLLYAPDTAPTEFTLNATHISGSFDHVYMTFTASGTGTAPVKSLIVSKNNITYMKQGPINVTITEFGPAGISLVSGNLSATLKDSSNNTAPVTLSFRVKRMN
jgi:hypothetical protein